MYNLVISGGGVKGILHLGALKILEEKNILKNIKNLQVLLNRFNNCIIIMYWIYL